MVALPHGTLIPQTRNASVLAGHSYHKKALVLAAGWPVTNKQFGSDLAC